MSPLAILPPSKKFQPTRAKTQFLFVHHDATNVEERVNAQTVNAHVQVLYRRRKRGVSERWEPSTASEAKQLRLKMKDGVFISSQGRWKRQNTRVAPVVDHRSAVILPEATITRLSLQKGNSDPFSAMPLAIGPVINMILSWHRDQGIPALNPVESTILESPTPSARRIWAHAVFSLQNPNLVYPYLASISALMARRFERHDLRSVSLQLKDQGYIVLRTTLLIPGMIANFVTRSMILAMFWAELATGKPAAARTHLKMLHWIVRSSTQSIEVPAECKLRFLAADTNLAVSQLTMPVANARDMLVERHFEDWKDGLTWEMNEMFKVLGLHASIANQELRTVFTRLRELVAVTELVAQGQITHSSVFQWMDARLLSCESHLVALCVEHGPKTTNTGSSATRSNYRIEHCISLAALAWIASTWASSNRGIGPTMARRLKEGVARSGLLKVGAAVDQDLISWMLYAGAALECRDPQFSPCNAWFSSRLRTRIRQTGLAHSTNTFRKLLYSEGVCPLNLAWEAP